MDNYQDESPLETRFSFLPNLQDTYNLKNLSETIKKKFTLEGPYFKFNFEKLEEGGFLKKKPMVAELNDARILGDSNIILNEDSNACIDSLVFNPNVNNKVYGSNYLDHFIFENEQHKFISSKKNYFNEGIFIGSSLNFGHWLHNNLAKLIYFDDIELQLPIIINENTPKNSVECLKLIGIKEKNIIYLKAGEVNFFNKLHIPMMPWHFDSTQGMWWTPNSFSTLRKYLSVGHKTEKKELKLFISRKDAHHRRLENEDIIFKKLENLGYIRILPSELSIKEQVDLACQASEVISPQGAGSFLFLFMQEKAKLIELTPPGKTLDITGPFAKKCNLNFKQITGKISSNSFDSIQDSYNAFSRPDKWYVDNNIDPRYIHDYVEFGQSDYNIELDSILNELK